MDNEKIIIKLLKEQGKTLNKIESVLKSFSKNDNLPKPTKQQKSKGKKYSGLRGTLTEMIQDSFFDTPKELKEIMNEMKARAVFYPRTNYPDSLLRMVKEKQLRRLKENKKWKYVKYG